MRPAEEGSAVPVLVLTRHQDHVEAINGTLRRAGHPVHCTWLPDANDLADALIQINPELLVLFADEKLVDPESVPDLRMRAQPPVPAIFVRAAADERTIAADIRNGAQDTVTLADRERLQLVCGRELRAFRLERALLSTLSSARESRQALQSVLAGSADAIAHVHDGIVVDANPAWLELFGYPDAEAVRGLPVMDLFDSESHTALKGALVACLQGKWANHALRVVAQLSDGSTPALELQLAAGEFEGDRAVRLSVPAQRTDEGEMQRRLDEAVQTDPGTGALHRRYFVERLRERLAAPQKGGVRFLAFVRPDRFDQLAQQVGPLEVEDFVGQFAGLVRDQAQPGELCGRFTGTGFMLLVERGTPRDVEAWAENLVRRVAGHVFRVGDRTITATATIGLGLVPPTVDDPAGPVADAWEASRRAREAGGNQVHAIDRVDSDTRIQAADRIWVRHIKAALMDNRFRLVQQPIASLQGEDKGMYDVLVRMLDEQKQEVLPAEFMPAAERNDLMKAIDRWVVGASLKFCAKKKPTGLFVRLSRDSIADRSLGPWLETQLKAGKVEPQRLVFQAAESIATQYLLQAKQLRDALRGQGFRFAVEHFGVAADPQQLIDHLRPEFVKIDGSLMQGLATNKHLQARVKALVEAAQGAGAVTIAERVEDANTMAVLWQLGIEFIQGYFVHRPEDVVLG